MIIPIDPNQRYKEDIDGVMYVFRYMTCHDQYKQILNAFTDRTGEDMEENEGFCKMLIDSLLVGWEGDNLPPVPENVPLSSCFKYADIFKMGNVIFERLNKLCGLDMETAKN